jgi:hypothetical protein
MQGGDVRRAVYNRHLHGMFSVSLRLYPVTKGIRPKPGDFQQSSGIRFQDEPSRISFAFNHVGNSSSSSRGYGSWQFHREDVSQLCFLTLSYLCIFLSSCLFVQHPVPAWNTSRTIEARELVWLTSILARVQT